MKPTEQPSLFSMQETVDAVLRTKKAPTVHQTENLGPLFTPPIVEPEAPALPFIEKKGGKL